MWWHDSFQDAQSEGHLPVIRYDWDRETYQIYVSSSGPYSSFAECQSAVTYTSPPIPPPTRCDDLGFLCAIVVLFIVYCFFITKLSPRR